MSSPFSQCIRRQCISSDVSGRVVGTAATISAWAQLLCWSRATFCTARQVEEAIISCEGPKQCRIQCIAPTFQISGLHRISGTSQGEQLIAVTHPDPGWHLHLVKHEGEGSGAACQVGGYPEKALRCYSSFCTRKPVLGCVPKGKWLRWGDASPLTLIISGWLGFGLGRESQNVVSAPWPISVFHPHPCMSVG